MSNNNSTKQDDNNVVIMQEGMEPDGGPQRREKEFFSERMTSLIPSDALPIPDGLESTEVNLDEPSVEPGDFWINQIRAFRRRQKHQMDVNATPHGLESMTTHKWKPIGPFGVSEGLAVTLPVVSGRTVGLAIAPDGTRVYAATANGGVWCSEDRGDTWRSLMDAFDLNPTNHMSDSLACGAIALVAGESAEQDTIFVGSGEGHGRAYFGVGPIVSIDGGQNWQTEPVSPESDELAGSGFYALAVDPNDPDRVIAATRRGIYCRESNGYGAFHWKQKKLSGRGEEIATSVVAVDDGGTKFYAALHDGLVYSSSDGDIWEVMGNGFPEFVRRITLAAQPDNGAIVYAFIEDRGRLLRLDLYDGEWREVRNVQEASITSISGFDQGFYDLSIVVAPDNTNLVYLGGSARAAGADGEEIPFERFDPSQHVISGSLYRCKVKVDALGEEGVVSGELAYIGASVHADIHALVFEPSYTNTLWVGCDGGVFCSDKPTENGLIFIDKNKGLQTMTMNHLGQHPTDENILFSGTQDNGIIRFTGDLLWSGSYLGDCGYCIVNWQNPDRILAIAPFAGVTRSEDGGTRNSYQFIFSGDDGALLYAPAASTPIGSVEQDANIVALGTWRLWFSENFGDSWVSLPTNSIDFALGAPLRSIVFSSATKIYAGLFQDEDSTESAKVYKFENVNDEWIKTDISMIGGAYNLHLRGSVTDIAIDYTDPSGDSIYITLGGHGDNQSVWQHVWHFDGTQWQPRSGPSINDMNSLLDIQHNAIVTDPLYPRHLYVGADIGIWRSTDGGQSWSPFSQNLPDAAVIDLKLHAKRLLRASTHGRGVYECRI